MKTTLFNCLVFGSLLVILFAGGCTHVVQVDASSDICNKSVEVHLVGVNRFEKDQWDQVSMTDYWTPGNRLRESAKEYTKVIQFGKEPCERTLSKKDPIHKVWKKRKADYLFIMADLPGIFNDVPGNADERRLRLPAVNSKCWKVTEKTINIAIQASSIVSLTIPN